MSKNIFRAEVPFKTIFQIQTNGKTDFYNLNTKIAQK